MRLKPTTVTYMLIYVDDIILTGSSPQVVYVVKQLLHQEFALKDLGPLNYFLGIEVTKTSDDALVLSQQKYICDLLHKVGMTTLKLAATPMTTSIKLLPNDSSSFSNPSLYRSIVSSLHYATITHPEISFVVSKVS